MADVAIAEIRPCLCPRAGHRHGDYLAFLYDGCRCELCVTAHRRKSKMTAYRTVTGTHSYVDAKRARQHVLQLLETLTVGQVEQRSGIHRTAIRVLTGDFPGRPASKRIQRRTESALLAVTGERVGSEASGWVDPAGTRRRLQALVAIGWPMKWLGNRSGISSRTTWTVCHVSDADTPVTVSLRDRVLALYNELSMTPPPPGRATTRARNVAASHGWLPPLAWDDDRIDDPDAAAASGTEPRVAARPAEVTS